MRLPLAALFLALSFVAASPERLKAQTSNERSASLLRELLDLPAPAPADTSEAENTFVIDGMQKSRGEEFYSAKNMPPDDAALEDLFDYWQQHSQNWWKDGEPKPTETALRRMLEATSNEPEKIENLLPYLPEGAQTAEIVKRVYDGLTDDSNESLRDKLKDWLKENSNYFNQEMLSAALKVKDLKNGEVKNSEEISTLAGNDFEAARLIIERLANDRTNLRSQALAKRLLYEHALETKNTSDTERYRNELKAIVENRTAPGRARDTAIDALFLNDDFDGRDDWYVNLMSDETLLNLKDADAYLMGMSTPIRFEASKWLQTMIKLVGSPNRNVHNAAVRNLIALASDEESKKAALAALLPWLINPQWAFDSDNDRETLIEKLGTVELPESIPGLISVAINEDGNKRRYAVLSLSKYKDSRIVPALKVALEKETSEYLRNIIINTLIETDGLTDEEKAEAILAYATLSSTEAGQKLIDSTRNSSDNKAPLAPEVSIGKYLSDQKASDAVINRLLEHLNRLENSNPTAAQSLSSIIQKWQASAIETMLLRNIRTGKANLDHVVLSLARREKIRESSSLELLNLLGANGFPHGIGAVVQGDESEMARVLAQSEPETQIAMLAAARLVRAKLPIAQVGASLNDKNKLLTLAAERYLESEDSPAAQVLLLKKHSNEAHILGARDSFNPANNTTSGYQTPLGELFASVNGSYFRGLEFPLIDKTEEELKKELLENDNLQEIYGFLANSESGSKIVRVYKDKAVFTAYEDAARYHERLLTVNELGALRSYLISSHLENISPESGKCIEGCNSRQFLSLNRFGGRRAFIQNGFPSDTSAIKGVADLFLEFSKVESKLRYKLADKIKGLEVLLAEEKYKARAVWKNGDDLRVLIEEENVADDSSSAGLNDDEDEDEEEETGEIGRRNKELKFQQEQAQKYLNFSWREIKNGTLGQRVAQPAEAEYLPGTTKAPEIYGIDFTEPSWQVRSGIDEIRTGDSEKDGLWRIGRTHAPIKIHSGSYGYLLVTPNGKWVITSKSQNNNDTNAPRVLVRINLQTGKEFISNLKPTEGFLRPICFIQAHNKVLIGHSDAGSKPQEYYLLDAETGISVPVKGDFRVFDENADFRPLQQTKQTGVFWAAIPDKSSNSTEFGLYDTQKFEFKTILKIPSIQFESLDSWVDDAEGRLYFVYNNHLLSLALPNTTQ